MTRISRPLLGLGIFVLLYGLQLEAATVNKELEGIKQKIAKERQGIYRVRKKEGSELGALRKIERDLAKKTKDLKTANARLAAILSEMAEKETQAERLRSSLDQRRGLLMKRAVALYRWHRGGGPLVFLRDGVPLAVLLRRQRYLETTVRFDRKLVQQLSAETAHQERVTEELARKKEELHVRRGSLAELQEAVRKDAEKKKQLLASLRQEKTDRARALKELEQAAARLQKMMDEISRRPIGKRPGDPASHGIELSRGKLEWPVRGKIASGFGKTRHPEFSAEVFRQGIAIEAPIGEEIKAVENGQIVFAERFSGYGKMVIVDHGNRYFSVYAYLADILKKKGDKVERGEALGRVGDSDALAESGLYFEMRKDGKPIDPLPWFRK